MSTLDLVQATPASARDRFLSEKRQLEDRLLRGQADPEWQTTYVRVLSALDRLNIGIMSFVWPSVTFPLFFRCGSSDLANFVQIFVRHEYGFHINFTPKRILDLGAYVGYASVYLANRFANAEIVSVEPSPDNYRMLCLNAGGYSNIRTFNTAVWGETTSLVIGGYGGGDWGTNFRASDDTSGIRALSYSDLLGKCNWPDVDFLKCDIEGAELSLFSHAGAQISRTVGCCAVETHDLVNPGCRQAVRQSFDPLDFDSQQSGEFDVYMRKDGTRYTSPPVINFMRPAGGIREIELKNVSPKFWGYHRFGEGDFQIHPAEQSSPEAAELSSAVDFAGQTMFSTEISLENPLGHPVDFKIAIGAPDGRSVVLSAVKKLEAGDRTKWEVPLPALHGAYRVTFSTKMAPPAPTSHRAVANWHNPQFR